MKIEHPRQSGPKKKTRYILGIETSCDETAASVVADGRAILSNVVATSLQEHQKYGGIIPEIASRRQMELIPVVVASALEQAGLTLSDIDAVAVTRSPGLIGSLLVGISYARALAYAAQKPLIAVDHIKAHLYANFLYFQKDHAAPPPAPGLPAIGLVVSGGHSSLYAVKDLTTSRLLGQTRDDAAGEAFDKVARILELGYPGGPVIDRLAKTGKNKELTFPRAALADSWDFSFSGVKTAVLYHTRKHRNDPGFRVENVAYAFQESVVGALVDKCRAICKKKKAAHLLVGGGVAANSALREKLSLAAQEDGLKVWFPPLSLCLDNAAMVAGLGYQLWNNGKGRTCRV